MKIEILGFTTWICQEKSPFLLILHGRTIYPKNSVLNYVSYTFTYYLSLEITLSSQATRDLQEPQEYDNDAFPHLNILRHLNPRFLKLNCKKSWLRISI